MTINVKSLKVNLATIIKTLTGKNVIWMNQNSNTPAGEFLMLKISSMRMVGFTDYYSKPQIKSVEDDAYMVDTQGDRELILSIQCISENCMDILLDLLSKLNLNNNLSLLSSKKIAFVDLDGDISDISTMINNSFESRATVDLIFRISKNYSSATDNEIEIVESIGSHGTLNGNGVVAPVEVDLTFNSTG